jgi:hypothetical protein
MVEGALDHYCQFTYLIRIPRIHVFELIRMTHVFLDAYLENMKA